jgi:HEAT repeat protein
VVTEGQASQTPHSQTAGDFPPANEKQPIDRHYLLNALETSNPETLYSAVATLLASGQQADSEYVVNWYERLRSGEEKDRAFAAILLGANRWTVSVLINHARNHSGSDIRMLVHEAIIHLADDQLLRDIIVEYDQTEDTSWRQHLSHAVSQIQNPKALPSLAQLAEGIFEDPRSDTLADSALFALTQMGTPPSTDALISMFDRAPEGEASDLLAASLSSIRSPNAVTSLFDAAHGGRSAKMLQTRILAVEVLALQPGEESRLMLKNLAESGKPEIREAAKAALKAGGAGRR